MIGLTVGAADSPASALAEEVNWSVCAGDYWVVGGLPGSGKSNLLATAAGLNRPERGMLRWFGKEVGGLSDEALLDARSRVGIVFENGGRPFNHLTVAENIALPLRYHRNRSPGEVRETVEKLLQFAGLTPLAYMTPSRVKPAERQRIALARALTMSPDVLLLDNPLAVIAPQEARWWRDCLADLSAGHDITGGRPITLVVACDDLRPWADQGRQFALLNKGRWVPVGGPEALAACSEPLLQELLATPFLTAQS
ncbi:MAG TPA: ATP-binding cassette domain-containing protein [Verrucomicrobiae bacterium]|nr:ATP-binding cassette domain-containing protein [Verrucomicrobiae bacterium]